MKVKPKNAKSAILLIVIIVGAILAMRYFNIGAPRSALRVGYVGNEGWSSWTAKYTTLDGNMQRTLHPKDDVLHIEVETEKGTLSIEIKDSNGTVIFDEDNIGTQSYDIEVSGKITVRIDADNHKGSFKIGSQE